MMFVCGTDQDFNNWAAAGNTGWDYNSIRQLLKKIENNSDSSIASNTLYHSTTGPLGVGKYGGSDSYAAVLRAAFTELGYQQLKDFNAQQYNGVVDVQGTIKGGERSNAARAYLYPVEDSRPNLYIMRKSHVTSVFFSGTSARGVNVRTAEKSCTNIKMYARREVILSAGAINSPKILMQSGIGRSAGLTPWNITQLVSLNVGYNLQDHVVAVHFLKINPNAPSQGLDDVLWDCQNYYFSRTGPFTGLGSMNTNGFINTQSTTATYPDIQYIHYRFMKSQEYLKHILANFGYKDQFIARLVAENVNFELVMVFTTLLNPKSSGTVKLASTDPMAPPSIKPSYFSNSADLDVLLRGINKLAELITKPSMVAISASFVKFDLPACNSLAYPSDDYWKCYLKTFSASLWHPCGTCKMGPSTDPYSVVDKSLRVRGVSRLRVADASIMPNVTSSNTQCPCYIIGEKVSALIISTWVGT